jgi:hypothetical protein
VTERYQRPAASCWVLAGGARRGGWVLALLTFGGTFLFMFMDGLGKDRAGVAWVSYFKFRRGMNKFNEVGQPIGLFMYFLDLQFGADTLRGLTVYQLLRLSAYVIVWAVGLAAARAAYFRALAYRARGRRTAAVQPAPGNLPAPDAGEGTDRDV